MSRIGRRPIPVPPNVQVEITDDEIRVKGPLGTNQLDIHPFVKVEMSNGFIVVSPLGNTKQHRALHGLYRVLINNMIEGVTKGFEKVLEIVGVGYRASMEGEKLVLNIGYSHPVVVSPKPGVSFSVSQHPSTRNWLISVKGIDKQVVGQQAAEIRALRPPDSYHGKGIRYLGEIVHLKPGKAAKVGGAR